MPTFQIVAPDGREFKVTGPSGATREQALEQVMGSKDYTEGLDPYLRNVPQPPDVNQPTKVTGAGIDPVRAGKVIVGAEKPESMSDYGLLAASAALPIAGAGMAAGRAAAAAPSLVRAAAPTVGRMVGAGLVGAGREAAGGGDAQSVLFSGLLDAVVGGLTEGAMKVAGSGAKVAGVKLGLKEWGAPVRAFEYASKAPKEVLDTLAERLPSGKWVNAPSLSKQPMTFKEAVEKLVDAKQGKKGLDYQVARAEIAHEMNRLDIQRVTGPKPLAGQVFKKGTSPERFDPSDFSRFAESARRAIGSNTGRSIADALTTTPIEGAPLGAWAGAFLLPQMLAEKVPGARQLIQEERVHTGGQ